MSLATSAVPAGASAASSGLAMAHGGPSAMSTHQSTQQSNSTNANAGPQAGIPPPNTSAASLAADLIDKNNSLNWKNIKSVSHLPIVSLDLYGGDNGDDVPVAFFPPVDKDQDKSNANVNPEEMIKVKSAGTISTNLTVSKNDERAYKTFKKVLSKSKGYESVFPPENTKTSKAKDDQNLVFIQMPHLLLGARRTDDLHPSTSSKYTIVNSTHPISPATSTSSSPVSITNGNLDGSTSSQSNDYDRIMLNLSLHSDKKPISALPEELLSIPLAQAKRNVSQSIFDTSLEKEEEAYLEYPMAVALPGYACLHHTVDGLMDAAHGGEVPMVLYSRSTAALVGSLIPKVGKGSRPGEKVWKAPKVMEVYQGKVKEYQEKLAKEEKERIRRGESPSMEEPKGHMPIFVLAGVTSEGVELTAIQVGCQNQNMGGGHAPLGEFRVIANVAYTHNDPVSIIGKSMVEFTDVVDELYPELEEEGGIAAIVTYGTITKQLKTKDAISKTLSSIKDDAVWNSNVTFVSAQEDAVAMGTSLLAAVTHVRIDGEKSEADEKKARPTIVVKNVSPNALAISYNYFSDDETKWTEPKVVFDYDRRVLPNKRVLKMSCSAAECAAIRADPSLLEEGNEEKLVEAVKKYGGKNYIPQREQAAFEFKMKILQRVEREGKWRVVDEVVGMLSGGPREEGDESPKLAYEDADMTINMDAMGYIDVIVQAYSETVVEALQSKQTQQQLKWLRFVFCIVFFGGWFVKSWNDDRILKRDTNKLLAYYKHACPGTINDGDHHNARYLAYKYRGKKEKLWKRLEDKYGEPVLEEHEWPEEEVEEETEEEEVDLDKEEEEEKTEF